ncbi:MAG: hypothetical protein AAFR61_03720 [Bacteroidota bacterium]
MNGNALHIASIGKLGDLPALLATLGSTLLHLPPEQPLVLHLVDLGLPGNDWEMLQGLMKKLHPSVEVELLSMADSPLGLENKPGVAAHLIPPLMSQWLRIKELWFLPPGYFILHPLAHGSLSEGRIVQPFSLLPDQTKSERFYLNRLRRPSASPRRDLMPLRLQLDQIRYLPHWSESIALAPGQDFYFWHQRLEKRFEDHWIPHILSAPAVPDSYPPDFQQFFQENLALQFAQEQKPWETYRTDLHALLFYDLFRELKLGGLLHHVNDNREAYLTNLSNSAFLVPFLGVKSYVKRMLFLGDLGYEDRYQAWYWKNLRRQQKELFKHINEVEAFRNTLRTRVRERLRITQPSQFKPSDQPKAL